MLLFRIILICSEEGPSQPCPFEDLEEADEDMSESDWHMQQAIEASMNGQPVNPSVEEEMFGKPHAQVHSRVSVKVAVRGLKDQQLALAGNPYPCTKGSRLEKGNPSMDFEMLCDQRSSFEFHR